LSKLQVRFNSEPGIQTRFAIASEARNGMNDETPETAGGQVAVYEDARGEVRVDVRLDRETVGLTQRQMAEVFDSTLGNVLMHLRNIFASGELEAEAITKSLIQNSSRS